MKNMERIIMIFQLIGTWNSGCLFFDRVLDFAFLAIRRIRIPVRPPEITPPTPSIRTKPMKLKYVDRM